MRGIDFFLKFRTYCRNPVIFLSANADLIEEQLSKIDKPAAAYICMPFSQRHVITAVRSVLRLEIHKALSA